MRLPCTGAAKWCSHPQVHLQQAQSREVCAAARGKQQNPWELGTVPVPLASRIDRAAPGGMVGRTGDNPPGYFVPGKPTWKCCMWHRGSGPGPPRSPGGYLPPAAPRVSAVGGEPWEKGTLPFPACSLAFLSFFESASEEQTPLSGSWVILPVPAGSVQIHRRQMAASSAAIC